MICKKDFPARVATITIEPDQPLDLVVLDTMIQHVITDAVDFMGIDLIIDPRQVKFDAELQQRGFKIAGTLTADAVTRLRLRKNLRQSSESSELKYVDPNLAVAPHHPGGDTDRAILPNIETWLDVRYNDEVVKARVEKLSKRPPVDDTAAEVQRLAEASLRTEERRKEASEPRRSDA